jgi:hypothetical protein
MKKSLLPILLTGAALLFGGPQARAQGAIVGPAQGVFCNTLANATVVAATTTLLQAGVAGKVMSICGWHVTSAQSAVTAFQFIYGTGATCGTGTVNVTPAFSVTSTAPATDHVDYASITIPQGNSLCVVTAGSTVGMQVGVWVSQY